MSEGQGAQFITFAFQEADRGVVAAPYPEAMIEFEYRLVDETQHHPVSIPRHRVAPVGSNFGRHIGHRRIKAQERTLGVLYRRLVLVDPHSTVVQGVQNVATVHRRRIVGDAFEEAVQVSPGTKTVRRLPTVLEHETRPAGPQHVTIDVEQRRGNGASTRSLLGRPLQRPKSWRRLYRLSAVHRMSSCPWALRPTVSM